MKSSQGRDNSTPDQDAIEQTSDSSNVDTSVGTYTKEQLDKAKSDALAAAGRERVKTEQELTETKSQLQQHKEEQDRLRSELAQIQQERDEAEAKAVKDNPDALNTLQQRQKQRDAALEQSRRDRELQRREADLNEGLNTIKSMKAQADAQSIASEYQVSAKTLLKFTNGTHEQMQELAKELPKTADSNDVNLAAAKPDSGVTTGTHGKLTKEQAAQLPMGQYAQAVKDGRI